MFVADLFEDDRGEPDFMFEYVYQAPKHLYLKAHGDDCGAVKVTSCFTEFIHSFSAPELLPYSFSYLDKEENCMGGAEITERCDVWLFGCILFNLVTGTPPFYDSNISLLIAQVKMGKYKEFHPLYD